MDVSYGWEAVERLGMDPSRVFKTLLVSVDGKRAAMVERAEGEDVSPGADSGRTGRRRTLRVSEPKALEE